MADLVRGERSTTEGLRGRDRLGLGAGSGPLDDGGVVIEGCCV